MQRKITFRIIFQDFLQLGKRIPENFTPKNEFLVKELVDLLAKSLAKFSAR